MKASRQENLCQSTFDSIGSYLDLYETLKGGVPLGITLESVRRQIAILEKCYELSPV